MSRTPIGWKSRGIGLDETPGCFICGCTWRDQAAKDSGNPYMHNIAAIVSKDDELLVLACFDRGARMAYLHEDTNVPQIKVGACTFHLPELKHLSEQWFISRNDITYMVKLGVKRLQYALEDAA